MAEDFQPSKWWNTSNNCKEHSDSNIDRSSLGYSVSSSDWRQTQSDSSGIAEPSLHALLQEDLSKRNFFWQELKEMNQPLSLDASAVSSSPFSSPLYGCSAYSGSSNDMQQNPLLLNCLARKYQSADINLMQFTNTSSFGNASTGFYHSSVSPIDTQYFEAKPCFTSLTAKSSEGPQEKKSSSDSVPKKARVETLAPFKVRKEKLGDRITALQQLVSPFGKTDTASVLHEAIEYIKFLQDQVSVLSSPYLMNPQHLEQQKNSGKLKKREDSRLDLRSRGLCLVPIASTYTVTSEASSDLWTPTFGGTYN